MNHRWRLLHQRLVEPHELLNEGLISQLGSKRLSAGSYVYRNGVYRRVVMRVDSDAYRSDKMSPIKEHVDALLVNFLRCRRLHRFGIEEDDLYISALV